MIRIFFLLWFVSAGVMYFLHYKGNQSMVFPGDIYFKKGPRELYIPIGSSLFLAIFLFIILRMLFV